MKDLLFAAIELTGKSCAIIGGGMVAERKVKRLLRCGASVSLFSPAVTKELDSMAADGIISVTRRGYKTGDLKGAFLAVIATDSDEVNREALKEATDLNILTNAAFDKNYGNIYFNKTKDFGDFCVSAMSAEMLPKKSISILDEIESYFDNKE
ncbi:bifunctional precorrin-2 dehydrogenase/sirohydrochlorin ferrochelatase [Thermodesulfobacteriota bacterium]